MSPATRTQTVEIDVIGVNDKSLFLLELLSQTLQELLLFLGHPLTVHNLTALGADQVVVELCRTANLVVFPAIAKVDFSENPHAQEKVKIPVHRCYADFLFLCPSDARTHPRQRGAALFPQTPQEWPGARASLSC